MFLIYKFYNSNILIIKFMLNNKWCRNFIGNVALKKSTLKSANFLKRL